MSKKRPLLLIAMCFWMGMIQACSPFGQAFLPSATATDTAKPAYADAVVIQAPTSNTPIPPTTPAKSTPARSATPTTAFTPTATLTGTPTLPPTLTLAPTDPLGDEEAPDGKVLHAILRRRDNITPEPLTATEYQPFETELLQLMNIERAKAGVQPLKMSPLLSIAAQSHSDEMAAHNFFGHNSLNGLSFSERIKKAGYIFTAAAENLFAGSGPYNSPEYVVKVWLNSSTHRENMLDPKYNEVGIGYRFNPDSTYGGYFTADFGTP